MFRADVKVTAGRSAFAVLELIFHASVRNIRKSNGNAIVGLLMSIVKSVVMVVVFLVLFQLLGARNAPLRGDFMLYIMTGIFNFMTHAATISAVAGSDGPTSAMMKHSPMNTIVAIAAAALGTLYLQTLSALTILFCYSTLWTPITIFEPIGVAGCFLLSWASGIGVGMIFKAANPWQPEFFTIATSIYTRANMIFSGKMFLANATPTAVLALFTWNPLFHTIDQTRGFMFENYHPHYSNLAYPIVVTLVLIVIGLMCENFTTKHASISWGASR